MFTELMEKMWLRNLEPGLDGRQCPLGTLTS